MKHEIKQAINFCIDALNNRTVGSQEVEGNDKYVLETLHEISRLPYQGRNLGIGNYGYGNCRSDFESMLKRCGEERITYSLDWLDALLTLFDFANYDETQMLESAKKIVNDNIMFNHVLKHIVTNCVVLENIELAEKLIPNFKKTVIFKEEDNLDMGYLIILKHFAMKGDDKNFFKYFKQSKPATNKSEVTEAKELLVNYFTQKNGIEECIALCKHKNLGVKYYFNALLSFASQGRYQELKQIFEQYPELKQPGLETELHILTNACLEAKKLNLTIDYDFEELFDRAKKMDRKLTWGDVKLQDSILFDLGLANEGNIERVKRCKKAIKNNWLKKELDTR